MDYWKFPFVETIATSTVECTNNYIKSIAARFKIYKESRQKNIIKVRAFIGVFILGVSANLTYTYSWYLEYR